MLRFDDKRIRRIVMVLAAVVALAAVIVGVSLIPGRNNTDAGDDARLEQRDLTQRASDALRAGDATTALQLATLALDKNPNDEKASDIAAKARRAQSSASSGGSSPSGGSPDSGSEDDGDSAGGEEGGAIPDPTSLLPKEFTGFALGSVVALDGDYSIAASARTGSSPVRTILWAIHDAKSAEGAAAFVAKTSKVLYLKDAATVEVDGVSAYFGTDGTRYASTVYTSGRYVFEVLVSGTDEAPAGYRDIAVSAAKAFAEQP